MRLATAMIEFQPQLSVQTLDALMRVRENIPDNFSDFLPTEEMYTLFNSNIYKKDFTLLNQGNEIDEICFNNPYKSSNCVISKLFTYSNYIQKFLII